MKKNNNNKTIKLAFILSMSVSLFISHNSQKQLKPWDYDSETKSYFVREIPEGQKLNPVFKCVTPNDNKYSTQQSRFIGKNIIGDIESVWDSYTGKGTTIAVIDDGFDYEHPEYTRSDGTSAISPESGYFYISGNSVGFKKYSQDNSCIAEPWEDGEWATHGTCTSTTAAAPFNNGGGVGIAPEATILALKVDLYDLTILEAMEYAVSLNVDVISISLGGYSEDFTDVFGYENYGDSSITTYYNDVCNAAYNKNIIICGAAGNEATYKKLYPTCSPHVIGVGATGDWYNKGNPDQLAEFTNYNKANDTGELNVDILAPGYSYTAYQAGSYSSISHIYDDIQGTSFSTPLVAGAACLWKEKYPNGTVDEFLSDLQSSADNIGKYKNEYVPASEWDYEVNDQGPSNITCGNINVYNLMQMDTPNVSVEQSSINITVGESKQIQLGSYNGTVTYKSNNTSIATVSNTGVVKGVAQGSTVITVSASLNGETASVEVPVTVSPEVAITSLEFSPNVVSLSVGDTYESEPTINVTPINASRIFLFETEDENIATVNDETGLITAVGVGTTYINVIAINGDGYDTLEVNVTNAVTENGNIRFGYGNVTVSSSNVTGKDNLGNTWTINTEGTTSFTNSNGSDVFSQIGSKKSPASKVTFTLSLDKTSTFSNVEVKLGGFSGTNGSVDISIDSTSIGSGNLNETNDVIITSNKSGSGKTLTVTVNNPNAGLKAYYISYSCISGSTPTPAPSVSSVSITPSTLALDLYSKPTGKLSATVNGSNNPSQNVTWTASNNVVSVDSSGNVTANSVGSATITATSVADNTKKATATVTVSDSTPTQKEVNSITLENPKTTFNVGDTFSFGGSVKATYSDGSSEVVTSSCTFTGYNMSQAGTYTVNVSYVYLSKTVTATYQISVVATSVSSTYNQSFSFGSLGTGWTLTNYSENNGYYLCPTSGNSIATFTGVFEGKIITSDVKITINNATYGSGENPSDGKFSFHTDSTCATSVNATRSGSLPTSSSYVNTIYTVSNNEASNKFVSDLVIRINSGGKQTRLKSVTIEFSYATAANKVINSLSASYTGGSVYLGGSLDLSKLSVTASYTDSVYKDTTLSSDEYTLSGFTSNIAGVKTVTVTYTGELETSISPLTTTFTVEVINDEIVDTEVSVNKTYHPGDVIRKEDLNVTLKYASGASSSADFTFEDDGYMFLYEDAPSGGASSNKEFEVIVNDETYTFSVLVSRAGLSDIKDDISLSGQQGVNAGITNGTGSSAKNYTNININGVTCSAENIYVYTTGGEKYFSFAKKTGAIWNTKALDAPIKDVSITILSGARNDGKIYVSTDGTSWENITSANTLKNNYYYFKIAYESESTSSYSNIKSINISFRSQNKLLDLVNYLMYEDTNNQCLNKFENALEQFNNLSNSEKETFMSSESYTVKNARERFIAWAAYKGVSIVNVNGVYKAINQTNNLLIYNQINPQVLLITLSILSISIISILHIKKRKICK